jgi:uncharacterized protein (TIGR02271 family)
MLQQEELLSSRGSNVIDSGGSKIGTIDDIYLDRETDKPEWAAVKTSRSGNQVTFVPLEQASLEGRDLRVPYEKDHVKGAPSKKATGELSQEEEAELYRYYGFQYSESRSDSGLPEKGAPSDDAMTRSEEEVRVGKAQREAGRARLKKYVVTEEVQQTVPVQREEVRVEREPVTDANVEQAAAGPEISESEHEVTLRAEEPVVEKRTVPKERVRLSKEPVTEEHEVSEQVRKEQIEEEGDISR